MPVFRPRAKPAAPRRRAALSPAERARIERRFRQAVNLSPSALSAHLATTSSRSVGFRPPGARVSVGRRSGFLILRLLQQGPRSEADYRHMRKVAGYVARHLAQRPAAGVRDSRWRASLMNWGHDPLKGI